MIRVIIESPYGGDVERNTRYLRAALRDCFERGEAPYASHGLYTQPGVLDDNISAERLLGIKAGFEFRRVCRKTVVYVDLGISQGMKMGIEHAHEVGHLVEYRTLPKFEPLAGVAVAYYTPQDILFDKQHARHWGITKPGWYAFDGPEGDEQLSGPFDTRLEAQTKYTRWQEQAA